VGIGRPGEVFPQAAIGIRVSTCETMSMSPRPLAISILDRTNNSTWPPCGCRLARTLGIKPQLAALARENCQQPIGFTHVRSVHHDGFNTIEAIAINGQFLWHMTQRVYRPTGFRLPNEPA
jgi:hypothetical protein